MESRVGDNIVGCVELNRYAGEGISEKLYKYYNDALNNDSTAYKDKCKIISKIWKNVSNDYGRHKIQDIVHVMEWGKHHTFDVVLDGQWNHQKEFFENVILFHLQQCEQGLVKIHKQFQFHFQGLIKVIQQPWDNEVLRSILQNPEKNDLTQKEIAYFANESGYATSMRIKKLVDAQCEDFAINLCSSYLKCLKLFEEGKVTLAVTEDQKKYAFDIYVALLYRVKRMDTIANLLKALSDKEAKELVGRFSSKNAVNCKVWKSSYKVTFFSAMIFLHRHAQLEAPEDQQTVLHIMKSWLKAVNSVRIVNEAVAALKSLLLSQDTTSIFIYTLIDGLSLIDTKDTRIELYIRALNKDLNRLETLRQVNEEREFLMVSQQLSKGLLKLAEEMENHIIVARECILTAFSLNPTKVIFDLIEKMAVRCGLNVLDTGQWECKYHAPIEPSKTTIECQTCNKHMKPINLRAFNTNPILSEALKVENVGLPQELCDDLVIVLCSPRYQLLSWLQEWNDLHRLCIMYLDNPEKTKNYITELKFVHIDYSLFQGKGKREEDFSLGYDIVLEESEPESADDYFETQLKTKKKLKKRVIRDSSDDETEAASIPSPTKSDPATLKSLRSFRKRKSDEIPEAVPTKQLMKESEVTMGSFEKVLEWNHNVCNKDSPRCESICVQDNNETNKVEEVLDLSFKSSQGIEKILEDQQTMFDVIMAEPCIEEIVDVLPEKSTDKNGDIIESHTQEVSPPISIENIIRKDTMVRASASKVVIQKLDNNNENTFIVPSTLSNVPSTHSSSIPSPTISELTPQRYSSSSGSHYYITDYDYIPETEKKELSWLPEPNLRTDVNIPETENKELSWIPEPSLRTDGNIPETENKELSWIREPSLRTDVNIPETEKKELSWIPEPSLRTDVNIPETENKELSWMPEPSLRTDVNIPETENKELSWIPEPSLRTDVNIPETENKELSWMPEPSLRTDVNIPETENKELSWIPEPSLKTDVNLITQSNLTESNLRKETETDVNSILDVSVNSEESIPKQTVLEDREDLDVKNDFSKKPILEDVTQITKDNIAATVIEEVIGQKIMKKEKKVNKHKSRSDALNELLLNKPKYRRLQKPMKYDDYLHDFPEFMWKTCEKQESHKNDVAQATGSEQEEDRRNETSPNVLKSGNYLQKYGFHPESEQQTNQEKSLFREKGTEGFYSEETGRIAKKPLRESNENKENAGYVSKRTIKGKIKKKPKKHRRLSKSEEKDLESEPEYENAYAKFLREVKVILDRINLPSNQSTFSLSTDPEIFKMCERLNRKLPRKPFSDKTQRILEKWRCKNPMYTGVNMEPKVDVQQLKLKKVMRGNREKWVVCDKSLRNINKTSSHRRTNLNNAKNILANVPGMKDTGLIQPHPVASVVQVVQMTGRSSNSSSTTQTSTQVTPHIQRVGQPRPDKPESSNDTTATTSTKTTTNVKPATTQSSLINILSHPVIRTTTVTTTAGRTPPVINILSNQIIRPASTSRVPTTTRTTTTTTSAMVSQSNNTNRSGESQLITQLTSPLRSSTTTGSASTIKVATSSEPSRILQFICQSSDGKLIPVSSFAQNCVVKVASSQNVSPTSPTYEENFPKNVKNKPSDSSADSEGSETLPKFQQAFGKSVYQSKSGTNSTNLTNNAINHEVEKPKITVMQKSIVTTTTTTTSVKPIPGGVIYTRQVQSGQTINLIPQSRGQVFRIATSNSDQISVVKDTLIQNKMNALLAAALSKKDSDDSESEKQEETSTSTTSTTRVAITRPGLVQNARIVKPVLQIPTNVIRNTPQNMSSTTLEQLREFDMVYKQVKERSSTTPVSEASTNSETNESQCISVTYLNQGQKINCSPIVVVSSYNTIQTTSSPAVNVVSQGNTSPRVTPSPSQTSTAPKITPKTSKGKTVKTPAMQNAIKSSPIPKPQQKPQEDEHTTQRIFDILAEYAEQLRNSPDLNNKPAPRRRSNPPTNPSQNSKRKKSSSSKKPSQSNSTVPAEPDTEDPRTLGSEDSSCGVMQLSVPDDDQPTTLASTSESNDSTSTPRQQLILTESSNQPRNLIIAESSVGEALKMPNTAVLVPGNYIMPVSMVKGGQQIAVVSGGSKILATVPARSGPNMLLFQSFLNQNRKSSVPTVKYSTIQPISGISSQSLAGVTAQPPVILPPLSHSISTVTLGQPITVKKLDNSGQVNTELLLTISQSRENDSPEDTPQPDSSTNVVPANIETVEIEEVTTLSENSSEKSYTPYQKPLITTPIATPVIAQTSTANAAITTALSKEEIVSEHSQSTTQTVMTLNIAPIEQKGEQRKTEERIQTVLVTASSSNGSMITQTRTTLKESIRVVSATPQNKDDFLRNNEKRNSDSKNLQSNNVYPQQGKIKRVQVATQRLDRELQQLCLQRKQAALERELRLQKSLSEECEDLGVDEPSTSDLFPEAELLFDANHSPSFEQTTEVTKRIIVQQEGGKEEAKLTLFSDDDFLFEAAEYQKGESAAEYDGRTNGQSTEAGSPGEDATLLRTCTSMSDVTLNSPISPDTFRPTTPPPLHKYVHKYSNRKKSDKATKQAENWAGEVSSSEDTGSNEVKSASPEICLSKVTEEELADGSFKVVRVAIAKRECGVCGGGACSPSSRIARRVKRLCSCCNGASTHDSRKRPAQPHQHVPVPQKKVFPVKKR